MNTLKTMIQETYSSLLRISDSLRISQLNMRLLFCLTCFLNFYNNSIIHIDFFKKVVMTVNISAVGKKAEFQRVRLLRLFQAAPLAD